MTSLAEKYLDPKDSVDLTNCDREPIHIPGSVQPHGALLVLGADDLKVVQASENVEAFLGLSAEAVLGKTLESILGEQYAGFVTGLNNEAVKYAQPVQLEMKGRTLTVVPHRQGELIVVELEPVKTTPEEANAFYGAVQRATLRLQGASDLTTLCQRIADEVQRLTSFDRVMVYQFDADWHGEVIAEAKYEGVDGFLGLHFPSADIPVQARRLYTLNWVRHIADVGYGPVPLTPSPNPLTGEALDMSYAFLRSVSPIHIQYLKNMGVGASLSISLLKDGQLWGLVACHHYSPQHVPYETLTACEFLGQLFSLQLETRLESEHYSERLAVKDALLTCVDRVSGGEDLVADLADCGEALLRLVNASGAAVVDGDAVRLLGTTPSEAEVSDLASWLARTVTEPLYATEALSQAYEAGSTIAATASGLLALDLSRTQNVYTLWFRPEVVQTVTWAGDPAKAIEEEGERLLPRGSFAAWQETVRERALPWQPFELAAAQELRSVLLGSLLRRLQNLEQANQELVRSNDDLDAFAYIASHDLKEPLRGIHNYAHFLLEDYGELVDEEGAEMLGTLVRLSQRMEELINSLLHFSRVGRVDLSLRETDLDDVVLGVRDLLAIRLRETGTEVRVPRPLPTLFCDSVRVGEVFSNLIGNAVKYNDSAEPWVEVGYQETPDGLPVFYVRDNGIGIKDTHQENVFGIFKRLHARDAYGGGTGVGLAIVKKVVERHGGRVWFESDLGEGTTFYFTLEGPTKA